MSPNSNAGSRQQTLDKGFDGSSKKSLQDERTSRGKKSLDYFHEKSYQALLEKSEIYSKMKSGSYHSYMPPNSPTSSSALPRVPNVDEVLFDVAPVSESMVEVEDEFGRTRLVPQSESYLYRILPAGVQEDHGRLRSDKVHEHTSTYDIHNDSPVERPQRILRGDYIQSSMFKLDEDAAQKIREHAEDNSGAETHYDPSWEIRTRGTGFYNFENSNQEIRKEQMENIKSLKEHFNDTEKKNELQTGHTNSPAVSAEVFLQNLSEDMQNSSQRQESDTRVHTDESDPLLISAFVEDSEKTQESGTDYSRRVNERKKIIQRLREQRLKHMNSFVKGDGL